MGEECRSLNDCLQQLTSNDINISNQKLNKIVDTCILLLYSEGEPPGSKVDNATKIVDALRDKINSCTHHPDEIEQLRKKVAELENKVKQLEKDKEQQQMAIQNLEKDVEQLKKDKQLLLLGQIAFKTEAMLKDKILDNVKIRHPRTRDRLTIPWIKKAIDKQDTREVFKSTEDIDQAKKNFEQLESKFPFDGLGPAYYYKTIKDLKSMRVPIAHPDVPESLDKVENDLVASDIESYQKKMGYELLDLIKYIQEHA